MHFVENLWGYSSVGRALASHVRGQRFESAYLHQQCKIALNIVSENDLGRYFFIQNYEEVGKKMQNRSRKTMASFW